MHRRTFLQSLSAFTLASSLGSRLAFAALPKMKITRVRVYLPPNAGQLLYQSDLVVTVETDAGVTGIGEGGSKDLLISSAGRLIGRDPQNIERLWQDMNRAYFYPAGRERTHAIGALDLALWDIKGKVLNLPVHQILGGLTRNYCECYNGGGGLPGITDSSPLKDRARATIEAGFRAFRTGPGNVPANGTFNASQQVTALRETGAQCREGVGKDGDWAIDFHQRFELTEAVRGCDLLNEFAPFFIEDPVRADAFLQDLPILRTKVATPIAAGEEWGNKWDFNSLVEHHDVDYIRATLPNVGGITEMVKIAALCETHFVGIIPHFTGPIATAALVNCLGTYSGPVLFEYAFDGRTIAHLAACFDFKKGKLYPNDRPGLGIELDMSKLQLIAEITEPITARAQTYFRPDGSITNW